MAVFGSEAVAGQATIDRISPVAFGLIYALSGAVGPVLAQNAGAGRVDRVSETLRDSAILVLATVLFAWAGLALTQDLLVRALVAGGVAAELVHLFCSWLAAGYLFTGALFVANAAFNNLGYPVLSTVFNWGRASLGTIPFVTYGAYFGPVGLLVGQAAGSIVFADWAAPTAGPATPRRYPPAPAMRPSRLWPCAPGTCQPTGARRVRGKAEGLSRWHGKSTARRVVPPPGGPCASSA
jgi:O-antigen/teichoic acid export membrane protein